MTIAQQMELIGRTARAAGHVMTQRDSGDIWATLNQRSALVEMETATQPTRARLERAFQDSVVRIIGERIKKTRPA